MSFQDAIIDHGSPKVSRSASSLSESSRRPAMINWIQNAPTAPCAARSSSMTSIEAGVNRCDSCNFRVEYARMNLVCLRVCHYETDSA